MIKRIQSFYIILFFTISFISCDNSESQPQTPKLASENMQKNSNTIDTLKNEPIQKIEKKLKVSFKTKQVEWGGDGKWHNMYQNDNGSYWVNYSDPFKIILTGYYSDLIIKIKSSSGITIFDESNVEIPENGKYTISNDKMIAESENIFHLEIKEKNKVIFQANIEGMPGGE